MSKIDINEIYTLFEEIKEIVKSKESNNTPVKPEIELPNLSAIDELSDKIDEAIEQISKPISTEHRHVFSFASSRTFIGVIGLCAICLISLFTVIYKQKEADSLKDNDLKYRYIHMMGEATPSLLTNLDSIFEYRRDSVKAIRKEVVSFEKAVVQRAKRLERARIKEMEAEKLREEVEDVK
ncbi:MAG: hypothetical protein GXY87_00375 [Tissierellia bacterium]|nr:hypothetical protein [Tissierellia bacterium]